MKYTVHYITWIVFWMMIPRRLLHMFRYIYLTMSRIKTCPRICKTPGRKCHENKIMFPGIGRRQLSKCQSSGWSTAPPCGHPFLFIFARFLWHQMPSKPGSDDIGTNNPHLRKQCFLEHRWWSGSESLLAWCGFGWATAHSASGFAPSGWFMQGEIGYN